MVVQLQKMRVLPSQMAKTREQKLGVWQKKHVKHHGEIMKDGVLVDETRIKPFQFIFLEVILRYFVLLALLCLVNANGLHPLYQERRPCVKPVNP